MNIFFMHICCIIFLHRVSLIGADTPPTKQSHISGFPRPTIILPTTSTDTPYKKDQKPYTSRSTIHPHTPSDSDIKRHDYSCLKTLRDDLPPLNFIYQIIKKSKMKNSSYDVFTQRLALYLDTALQTSPEGETISNFKQVFQPLDDAQGIFITNLRILNSHAVFWVNGSRNTGPVNDGNPELHIIYLSNNNLMRYQCITLNFKFMHAPHVHLNSDHQGEYIAATFRGKSGHDSSFYHYIYRYNHKNNVFAPYFTYETNTLTNYITSYVQFDEAGEGTNAYFQSTDATKVACLHLSSKTMALVPKEKLPYWFYDKEPGDIRPPTRGFLSHSSNPYRFIIRHTERLSKLLSQIEIFPEHLNSIIAEYCPEEYYIHDTPDAVQITSFDKSLQIDIPRKR